jgi:hypothetical protein
MKLFLSIALTLLIFSALHAQEKSDNLIVITTNRSHENNFLMFGKHLVSQGYSFETKDADFLSLVTNIKECRGGGGVYNYKMNISFNDSLINIRVSFLGGHADPRVQPTWVNWTYTSYPGTVNRHVYNDFDPKIKSYNYEVAYYKE